MSIIFRTNKNYSISNGSEIESMCCAFLRIRPSEDYQHEFVFKLTRNKDHYTNSLTFLKYLIFKLKNVTIKSTDGVNEIPFIVSHEFQEEACSFSITFNHNKNSYMLVYGIFCYLRTLTVQPQLVNIFNFLGQQYPKHNKLHLFEIINDFSSTYRTQFPHYMGYKVYSLEEVVEKLKNTSSAACQTHFQDRFTTSEISITELRSLWSKAGNNFSYFDAFKDYADLILKNRKK